MKALVAVLLMVCSLYSVVAFAAQYTVTRYNGDIALTCTIIYEKHKGGARTAGAPYGKGQTAYVILYNSNNVSIGSDTDDAPYDFVASANASNYSTTVHKVKTGHYALNSYGNPEYPLYQQIQLVEES